MDECYHQYDWPPPNCELLVLMLDEAERMRPGDSAWKAAILASRNDAIFSLILYLMPNLRELEVNDPYIDSEEEFERSWVLRFITESTGPNFPTAFDPFLANLSNVSIYHHDTKYGFNLCNVAPFLNMPQLRQFVANMALRCFPFRGEEENQ